MAIEVGNDLVRASDGCSFFGVDKISNVGDTTITAPTDGQSLTWDATTSSWINSTITSGGSVASINDIGDTTITAPTDGQSLTWDATTSSWINSSTGSSGSVASINDIGDVNIDTYTPATPEVSSINTAQYWRLNITAIEAGTFLTFAELEFRSTVGGVDITSITDIVTASNEFSATYSASKAVDNDTATAFAAVATALPILWNYTFSSPTTVAEYSILMSTIGGITNSPMDWTLEYSTDGVTWQIADTQTGVIGYIDGTPKVFSAATITTPAQPASGVATGDHLTYDSVSNTWGNSAVTVSDIGDTTITAPTDGQSLTWDATTSSWINSTLDISNIGDIIITTVADGQILTWDATNSNWVNSTPDSVGAYSAGVNNNSITPTTATNNSISSTATYNVITGGINNLITTDYSSISGGSCNSITTQSIYSSTGGELNSLTECSNYTFVYGKSNCLTGTEFSTVTGFSNRLYWAQSTFVAGSCNCVAHNAPNTFLVGVSISGGMNNCVSGTQNYTTISGGYANCSMSGENSVISGGIYNSILSSNLASRSSTISGGELNKISGEYNSISGGCRNCIHNDVNGVSSSHHNTVGGVNNYILGSCCSSISGGNNTVCLTSSTHIVGNHNIVHAVHPLSSTTVSSNSIYSSYIYILGSTNTVCNGASSSYIVGSDNNNHSSTKSVILGFTNTITGSTGSTILGGDTNTITGSTGSTILGGIGNINITSDFSLLYGQCGQVGSTSNKMFSLGYGSTVQSNTTDDFNIIFSVDKDGTVCTTNTICMLNLPIVLPIVPNQLWNNNGVLSIS